MSNPYAAFDAFVRRHGGQASFERFMADALYHPKEGYYTQHVRNIGRGGDFSTSSALSPVLGEAFAHWVLARREERFFGQPCALIELGPGNGSLMRSVTESLERRFGFSGMELFAVETSPVFRAVLPRAVPGHRIEIFDTLKQALDACEGRALVYSNEFPDAFPAVQLRWEEEAWQEVFLRTASGEPEEILLSRELAYDAEAPTRVREGLKLFIHASYHRWLQDNLKALRHGVMLTIDYGRFYPSSECRAYAAHQRYEDAPEIYADMGQRDVTCDVNFADLQRWGEQQGLTTNSLQPQAAFLREYVPDLETRAKEDDAVAYLSDPLGAGGAFLVLEQEKIALDA
ncbi:MAG: SAM-dependent methyltransferase [Verrucomicrobiota bacterium]